MNARVIAVLLALSACRPAPRDLSDADRAALADTLKQAAATIMADIDRHEVGKFLAHHDGGPAFAWATQGAILTLDSMRAIMMPYFSGPSGQNVRFSLGTSVAYPLTRDAGVVTAVVNSTNRDSTGTERKSHQAWSVVLQRRDGSWRVVQVHESYPGPTPE
jgi:hypothetical protein